MRWDIGLLLLLSSTFYWVDSAKILGIFPFPGSHHILTSSLMRVLAERGHEVTSINPVGMKDPPKTYKDIILTGFIEQSQKFLEESNFFDHTDSSQTLTLVFMSMMFTEWNEKILSHPNVQQLIQSDEKFDIVITEQMFDDSFKALAKHFDASLVILSSVGANDLVNSITGNPQPPSYVVQMASPFTFPMTFFQRLTNLYNVVLCRMINELYLYRSSDYLIKKYISKDINLNDVLYNASVVLLNSHPAIGQAVPHVPNMIEVGGFHIKPPKKLPKDLQQFLDEAKDGAIYFSMGSNLKSKDFPPEKRNAFLNVFRKLKQKVLWKWEDEDLPGKPDNVKISKWLPQQDILAHPNIKLFITHGGLLSTTETVYHGVPILAIPIFGDQKSNAMLAKSNGFAVVLPYNDITEQNLRKSLTEILENPKYKQNAKLRSELYHDQETKPMDRAVYWLEYVARHKGAPHLRVAGVDLPWYQYHLLDVFAFLLLIGSVIGYIKFLIIRALIRRFCKKCTSCSNKKGKSQRKKKNQ